MGLAYMDIPKRPDISKSRIRVVFQQDFVRPQQEDLAVDDTDMDERSVRVRLPLDKNCRTDDDEVAKDR